MLVNSLITLNCWIVYYLMVWFIVKEGKNRGAEEFVLWILK